MEHCPAPSVYTQLKTNVLDREISRTFVGVKPQIWWRGRGLKPQPMAYKTLTLEKFPPTGMSQGIKSQ